MVGASDAPTLSRVIRVFIATAAGDAPTLTDELLGLGVHTAPVDRSRLTQDLAALLGDVTNVPLGEVRLGPLLQSEMAIIRRHRLRLPPELALLVKTAAMTGGLASLLAPGFVLGASFAPYAAPLLPASARKSVG